MGEKRRVNLSLNLSAPHQREAWEIIRFIPAGQRTDAVCRMICKGHKRNDLLDGIRMVVREELRGAELVPAAEKAERPRTGDLDDSVLGFLRAMQKEEGDTPDSLF